MKKVIALLICLGVSSAALADLQAAFVSDLEGWSATPGATVNWVEVDSNGYAEAEFTNSSPWYFEAPSSWLGDWSEYEQIEWDLIISSGGYAVSNAADILVVEGANGTHLVWHGPAPYWEWTHYGVPLEAIYFGVDQSAFDGVISNVTAFRILGEYKSSNEDIGLDNVLLSTNSPSAFASLSSFFETDSEGWRPYDDVTLTWTNSGGNPSGYLIGNDWVDGRDYRFATPQNWNGDWSAFNTLTFDLKKLTGSGVNETLELVWIRGGSGETLVYETDIIFDDWTTFEIYLVPENFDTDQATFDRVMGHVTEMLILGEYVSGGEMEGLDNVVLSSQTLAPIQANLLSNFDTDLEGWTADGDGRLEWAAAGGDPDGYCLGIDGATGPLWHFVTPEAWKGNWINLNWLRFKMKSVTGATWSELPLICLTGMNGVELWASNTVPFESWTPYDMPLTPEMFNTNSVVFNSVLTYVKHLRFFGEFGDGVDRAAIDTFGIYKEQPTTMWPDRSSTFDVNMEDWRKLNSITLSWEPVGGNPDGFLKGDGDGGGLWHYVTPENWNGDWTGYKSLRFDHIILQGSNSEWEDPTFYIQGANNQTLAWKGPEASNAWVRFEVNLSPELFGVDQVTFDAVMERVVEVAIRGEYVNGSESEGLDNVFLSTATVGSPSSPILAIGYDGTNMVIQFQTESNVTYRLQACTNLTEGSGWEDVPGESLIGDGGDGMLESETALPARFLRLRAD